MKVSFLVKHKETCTIKDCIDSIKVNVLDCKGSMTSEKFYVQGSHPY